MRRSGSWDDGNKTLVTIGAVAALCFACSTEPKLPDRTSISEPKAFYVSGTFSGNALLDSAQLMHLDTMTAEGQRTWNRHMVEAGPATLLCDTLIDLNFDGFPDEVLGYYAAAGTGFKYGWQVHSWRPDHQRYALDSILNYLPNPTYFPLDSTITSFYLGAGAGSGKEMKWINGGWLETLRFEVVNAGDEVPATWILSHPMTGHRDTLLMPYQMLPPVSILRYVMEKP